MIATLADAVVDLVRAGRRRRAWLSAAALILTLVIASGYLLVRRQFRECGRIMLLRSRGIERSPLIENLLKLLDIAEIHVFRGSGKIQVVAMAVDLALPC